jgi:MFS family permease
VAFIGSGFAFASWAARIPQVRDRLELSSAQLGLVLLAIAAGSVVALPLAGSVVSRFGSRRTVAAMAVLFAAALAVAALGHLAGVWPLVVGLFLLGFGNGAWDVAMNVQGARVEQELSSSIMSRFHAGWSCGTVAGALVGALMVALAVPVAVHLTAVAVLVGVAVPLAVRRFLPDGAAHDEPAPGGAALTAWREPRTLLVGLFVLAFAFAEGAANDWINVALIDGYDASATVGAVGFAVFLAAMTTARWFGPPLLDRHGRLPVLRVCAVVAVAGLLLYVFAPNIPLALVGALLWGLGTSLGFPTGMSAAADDPRRAAARVSVVASIGYCAFLGGPPLIGFLAEHWGILDALLVVAALLAVAVVVTPALRPLRPSEER